jgi:hypothetical protein
MVLLISAYSAENCNRNDTHLDGNLSSASLYVGQWVTGHPYSALSLFLANHLMSNIDLEVVVSKLTRKQELRAGRAASETMCF